MSCLFSLLSVLASISTALGIPVANDCAVRLFVATTNGKGTGLVISTDLGETWQDRNPVQGASIITSIYALNEKVIIGANTGIALSTNGGHTWSFCAATQVGGVCTSNETAVAGITNGEVMSSSNNGMSWDIHVEDGIDKISGVYLNGDSTFLTMNHNSYGGLAQSLRNGRWKILDSAHGGCDDATSIAGDGQNIYVGVADRDGGVIFISEDNGDTWGHQQTSPLGSNEVTSVFVADGQVYVATNGGGISMSKSVWDSWSTKTATDGLASNATTAIAAAANVIIVGTTVGLSVSKDGGQTWVTKTTEHGLPHNNVTAVFAQYL